jgi:hypothetical protein
MNSITKDKKIKDTIHISIYLFHFSLYILNLVLKTRNYKDISCEHSHIFSEILDIYKFVV